MSLINIAQFVLFSIGTTLQQLAIQLELNDNQKYIKQLINGGSILSFSVSVGLIKYQQLQKRKESKGKEKEKEEINKLENIINEPLEFSNLHNQNEPNVDVVYSVPLQEPPPTQPNSPSIEYYKNIIEDQNKYIYNMNNKI